MSALGVARRQMVDCQILPSGITDSRLVAAMLEVPRELFLTPDQRSLAYAEIPLKLAAGRFMMEPAIFARLVQSAEIGAQDKVLVIGAGNGYGAAVISRLAAHVVAIEQDPALCEAARRNLQSAGAKSVIAREAVLSQGAPDLAPFQVIIIEGGIELLPAAIKDQLAEAGRLAAIAVEAGGTGRGTVYRAFQGIASGVPVFDAMVPVLPGFERSRGFRF